VRTAEVMEACLSCWMLYALETASGLAGESGDVTGNSRRATHFSVR
jgi:hypothetical protein